MRARLKVARNWLASKDRLSVLALRIRRALSVEKPLAIEGTQLRFTADSWLELDRTQSVVETWTADWVRSLPPRSVLWDVGANIGIFALLAAENPNVDMVVATEPAFFNYASLLRNALRNNLTDKVIALPVGLGEESAALPFNLQNLKSGGSLHGFGDLFPFHRDDGDPAASYTCLCYRLDDLAAIPGLPFPTHIKLDIDGHELAVLRGSETTLADPRLVGLQVEVMDHDPALSRREELVAFLAGHGWQLTETIAHRSTAPIVADLRFAHPG